MTPSNLKSSVRRPAAPPKRSSLIAWIRSSTLASYSLVVECFCIAFYFLFAIPVPAVSLVSKNLLTMIENEKQIRQLIEDWAAAVRKGDIKSILAHHSDDIVMYD